MMLGSQIYEKSNHYNGYWKEAKKLVVGDWVYYISNASKYSIKKSRIKEMHIIQACRPLSLLDSCELLLENGDTVDYDDTFNSKEDILGYLIEKIKLNIAYRRQTVAEQLKEIKFEERLQKMYEKRLKTGTKNK